MMLLLLTSLLVNILLQVLVRINLTTIKVN